MSRIGKKLIKIPAGVQVTINHQEVLVKGPKGELKQSFHHYARISKNDDRIIVKVTSNDRLARSIHGLTNRLINNMIIGVTEGFCKKLEYQGVGYRISTADNKLTMNLGFSHPVEIKAPAGINLQVEKNIIKVLGIDKQLVGQTAATIRNVKPVEPYKGKGIKYLDEQVKRKVGKIAKAAGPGATA